MRLVAARRGMYFGIDLSSTPESRSMQALASSTVDELLSLSSPWPLTAIFGFSAGATAGMDMTPIKGQADHDKQHKSASTDLRFRLSLCC